MEFRVIFRVEDHPAMVNMSTDDIGTALTYSPGVQWLASETITVVDQFQTTYTAANHTVSQSISTQQTLELVLYSVSQKNV